MKHELVKSIFLSCITLNLAGCGVSETENAFAANRSTVLPVSTVSPVSNAKNSSNEKSSDDSPLPIAVILPTKEELKTKGGKSAVLKAYLTDAWEKVDLVEDCNDMRINFSSSEHLCIVDNQIYIYVTYKLNVRKQKVYMYLERTSDLGEWAVKLNWKDFDTKKPIAIMDLSKALSTGLIEVKWLGFINKKTGEIYDFGVDVHDGTHRKQIGDE